MGDSDEIIHMKIDGKWLQLTSDIIFEHPGGPVIRQYANADATHMFGGFHEGSSQAFKQLEVLKKTRVVKDKAEIARLEAGLAVRDDQKDINVSTYDVSVEEEKKMVQNFEKLRQKVVEYGLMDSQPFYYTFKSATTLGLLFLAFYLQYCGYIYTSALMLGLAWQQFGWLTHEYCHHQPSKNRRANDAFGLIFGNVVQGYSIDWWKDKHNTHHAATNIVDHDGDIDLSPFFALIPSDLFKFKAELENFLLRFIPYQHLYFTLTLPLLRFSWTSQSVQWVLPHEKLKEFTIYQKHHQAEAWTIAAHWFWVLLQLYCLPDMSTRITYFLISQLLAGFLIAYVVTYNHNSVDKYPANSRLVNNFAFLQIMTTRNMESSPFIDWLWGGLNFQIEHHLFPTMPRCNLGKCSMLVREFCHENNLPYMVDNYWDGYQLNLKQLENVANLVKEKENQIASHNHQD